MAIIWWYLLSQYLKVLCLCTISFIAVLLTTRLPEIASFATLGSQGIHILQFTLYQIPYILPIAIPISCLISTLILVQRLSNDHELTALRSCGLSLLQIFTPIFFAAIFLSWLNFYIVSEIATSSHLAAGVTKNRLRSINPLLLLHNKQIVRVKGLYFDILGASRLGESADEMILAMPNKHHPYINLMLAKNVSSNSSMFIGTDITWISSLQSTKEDGVDKLLIENIGKSQTALKDFSQLLQKKVWTISNDHLSFSLLRARLKENQEHLLSSSNLPPDEVKLIKKKITRCYTEIARRLSLSLAVFTFTLMGIAFGMNISRCRSLRGIFCVIALASFYLFSYFIAKAIDDQIVPSFLLYLVPHLLIILFSVTIFMRVSKGVE